MIINLKPDHIPAHKQPCWLSSEDVKAAIFTLANTGTDKAACWDFMQAIYRLAEVVPATEPSVKCAVCLRENPPIGGCPRPTSGTSVLCPYRAVAQ